MARTGKALFLTDDELDAILGCIDQVECEFGFDVRPKGASPFADDNTPEDYKRWHEAGVRLNTYLLERRNA